MIVAFPGHTHCDFDREHFPLMTKVVSSMKNNTLFVKVICMLPNNVDAYSVFHLGLHNIC